MRIFYVLLSTFFISGCQDDSPTASENEPVKNKPVKNQNSKSDAQATKATSEPSQTCTYQVKSAKPEWTAYKFTDKVPVGGTFNTYTLSETQSAGSLSDAFKGIAITIDASSVESNNPARNTTITEQYFAKFAPQHNLKANVVSSSGDNTKGTMSINLEMNGVAKSLSFNYTYEAAKGLLEATSVMDMMDFNLQTPFNSIHEACKTLHTGPDGVAKTWTEVALKVTAEVVENCTPKK